MKSPQETPIEATQEHNAGVYPYCVPEAVRLRWLFGFITILLPVISFVIASEPGFLKPEWQSEKLYAYVHLMFSHPVPMYFYPFLMYAMVSMGLLLRKPNRYEGHFSIRFGIYTGVVLSLQYSLLVLLTEFSLFVTIATAAWILFVLLMIWLLPAITSQESNRVKRYVSIAGLIFIGLKILIFPGNIFILGNSLLSVGPIASFIVSLWVAVKLIKRYGFVPRPVRRWWIGVFGWALAYAAAWRAAVVKVLELYAELPPNPPQPDCYIATAAARGHPALVKSRPVRLPGEGSMRVNPQLRYLKCGELALMALAPRVHRALRAVYDRFGPSLAGKMTHPLLADLAYLSLKPFEWGVRAWLGMLVPNIQEMAERVYVDKV